MPRTKTAAPVSTPLDVQPAPAGTLPATVPPDAPQVGAVRPALPFYPVRVLKAINAVMAHIDLVGKAGVNKFHNYKYAKIEDVIGPVRDEMVRQGLLLIQSESSKRIESGLILVEYEFIWVHVDGDSLPPIIMSGAARLVDQKGVPDDKAIPKAHSQAEKYFLIKQLRIKVSDTPDSDADGPHTPTAGPNVIAAGVEPGDGYRRPAPANQPAGSPAPGGRGNADLDIKGIAALEKEAREAADRGTEVMAAFWRSLVTKQQQNIVKGMMTELIERRTKANQRAAALALHAAEQAAEAENEADEAAEFVDPETGEIIRG